MTRPVVAALLLSTLGACAANPSPEPDAARPPESAAGRDGGASHAAEIEEWRSRRVAGLTRDTGWLTLAGLHRLREGRQMLGSAPSSDIVLPASAPAEVGTLVQEDGEVSLESLPGVVIASNQEPWTGGALASDAAEEMTMLETGPVNFFVIERGDVRLLRVRDRDHAARDELRRHRLLPHRPEPGASTARFEALRPSPADPDRQHHRHRQRQPQLGRGGLRARRAHLLASTPWPSPATRSSSSSSPTTPAATRPTAPVATSMSHAPDDNGRIDLDFNRAYNPPCAFTPFATCPLPPRQNRLRAAGSRPARRTTKRPSTDAGSACSGGSTEPPARSSRDPRL